MQSRVIDRNRKFATPVVTATLADAGVYGFGRFKEIVSKANAEAEPRTLAVSARNLGLEWREENVLRNNASRARIMRELDRILRETVTNRDAPRQGSVDAR
jgi:hypothetical protein